MPAGPARLPRMGRSPTTHVDDAKRVGKRLRAARQKAGMSQRQLSFPGCTGAYVSRIEAGARVPSLQLLNELADRLNVSPQWLATGVESIQDGLGEILDAEVALRLGDLEEAKRLYDARLRVGDPARASALAGLGQIAFREERLDEAVQHLESALALRHDRLLADPFAVDTLGRAYAGTGALEQAIALYSKALDEARAAEASIEELRFAVLLANCFIDHGTFGDAEKTLADVIKLAKALRDPLAEARVLWSQSRLHVIRGESELAARYARRALDILERTENDAYIGMAYHLLAYAHIESGNGQEAHDLLVQGRELFGGEMTPREDAKFAVEETRALALLGRKAAAAKAGSRALELIEWIDPQDRGRAYVALGDVFLASGDRERARMVYGAGVELLEEHGKPYLVSAAGRLADLLEADGDTAGALAVLKRAASTMTPGSPAQV
jgi:tetratricopeptide (TPR) repeat protein